MDNTGFIAQTQFFSLIEHKGLITENKDFSYFPTVTLQLESITFTFGLDGVRQRAHLFHSYADPLPMVSYTWTDSFKITF